MADTFKGRVVNDMTGGVIIDVRSLVGYKTGDRIYVPAKATFFIDDYTEADFFIFKEDSTTAHGISIEHENVGGQYYNLIHLE